MKKSDLSKPIQSLIEMMQRLGFGEIQNLIINNGQPVLEPRPTVIREYKIGSGSGPRSEWELADFVLNAPMTDFVETIQRLGEAMIVRIVIKDGLPFRMCIEE